MTRFVKPRIVLFIGFLNCILRARNSHTDDNSPIYGLYMSLLGNSRFAKSDTCKYGTFTSLGVTCFQICWDRRRRSRAREQLNVSFDGDSVLFIVDWNHSQSSGILFYHGWDEVKNKTSQRDLLKWITWGNLIKQRILWITAIFITRRSSYESGTCFPLRGYNCQTVRISVFFSWALIG